MPRIFLSAVTTELRPAREIAARVLRTLGYEPIYQDEFPAGAGNLRQFLRDLIDPCDAVLQLIGRRYGAEPVAIDPDFGRLSYTQYEAEYARRTGKKVYYLLLEDPCAVPDLAPEDPILTGLQTVYRETVTKRSDLYHRAADPVALELKVHQLHDELRAFRQRLERRQKRTLALAVAAVVLAALIAWGVHHIMTEQEKQGTTLGAMKEEVSAVTAENKKLYAAFRDFSQAMMDSKQWSGQQPGADDEATILKMTYRRLAEKHGVPADELERELPKFAATLLARQDTSPLDRANALFIQQHYADAEKEALAAKDKALAAAGKPVDDAIAALELAGLSALEQAEKGSPKVHWQRALDHFRVAAALTSRERDPASWARLQNSIACVLGYLGRADEALPIFRAVVEFSERTRGPDDPDTLTNVNNLGMLLYIKGDSAGAEPLFRRVLEARERTLGPEHRSTLISLNNLAMLLSAKGDLVGAEPLWRRALEANERTLGKDHPATLISVNGFAMLLAAKGDRAGAEPLLRRALEANERTRGPENSETLASVLNLAGLLTDRRDLAGAEALYRRALEASERTLGPEHPVTLLAVNNFAVLLNRKGDDVGAERLYRRALDASVRTLGPEHPDTSLCAYNLADFLNTRHRPEEAKPLAHQAYTNWLRSKGPTHQFTQAAAQLLRDLGEKLDE